VLGGIDLSTLAAGDVKLLPDKRMQVTLPPPKIVHIVIDDKATKVWDRRITWWTPWVPYNPDWSGRRASQPGTRLKRPPWTWHSRSGPAQRGYGRTKFAGNDGREIGRHRRRRPLKIRAENTSRTR